jgi:hypothetical protein
MNIAFAYEYVAQDETYRDSVVFAADSIVKAILESGDIVASEKCLLYLEKRIEQANWQGNRFTSAILGGRLVDLTKR